MLFLALVLTPVLTWLAWQLWQVKVIQAKTHNIPGPPCKWFFGNALEFITADSHRTIIFAHSTALRTHICLFYPPEVLMLMVKYCKVYGNCFRLWFLNEYFVIDQDPKDLEIIMTSSKFLNKSHDYEVMTPWLGRGLLLSTGHKWHVRRKAITTAFHFKILDNFMQDFIHHSQRLVQNLEAEDLNLVHDVYPLMVRLGLEIICGE
jgi:cytochrome P450